MRLAQALQFPCLMATIAVAVGGCVPGPGDLDSESAGAVESIVFTEDADPVIAALSFIPDELLIQPYPGVDPQSLAAAYAFAEAVPIGTLPEIAMTVLRVAPERLDIAAIALGESGLIETAQKNYLFAASEVPNDPLFEQQSHLQRINAEGAWNTTTGDEQIVIAIVDTGVDPNHLDLQPKIIDGWNVYDQDAVYADVLGHGTAVAGVAGALSNNAEGVAGVSWGSPLLAVRASDESGTASARDVASGILWSVAQGASVINVSFAPLWSDRVVAAACREAFNRGSLVVISAGNGGGTTGARGFPQAIFAGALGTSDNVATFSDRGPFVDIAAPGVLIQTTADGGGYGKVNGTSFAAPIVSGVAALIWSINPDLRPITVASILYETSIDLGPVGKDTGFGFGSIDSAAAVAQAQLTTVTPDVTPPLLTVERPAEGAVLSRRYLVLVEASDDWGVSDAVLSIDGAPFATDTREPFRFVIDTTAFSPGAHELTFQATDLSGNASAPETVSVVFAAPLASGGAADSTIVFHSPAPGTAVTGTVAIQATVGDDDGLALVEWLVDGAAVFSTPVAGISSGISYLWHSDDYGPGEHRLTLIVTDRRGDTSRRSLTLTTG